MSEDRLAPDLRGLEESYVIHGELRGSETVRNYIASARDGSEEVSIAVVHAPKGGENNALTHFAADAQILARTRNPMLARVIEGRWLGPDSFAVVSERLQGDTLDQLLERGEKFPNPRIAMVLQDVSSALDWARDHGVVHRGVTPDTLVFERGTNRPRLSFTPTLIGMSGVPDACSDARTVGVLAWTMLSGERHDGPTAPRPLGEVSPNLATRVTEATDTIIRCRDHHDAPDVATFLGIIAAGDVMKQAEVEMAAMKEEYDEQHRQALQACEVQREAIEQHAAEQAAMLAGEREEFKRAMEDERAAIAAERAQFEQLMQERNERLAGVRAELDAQRAELERRVAELEKYRAEVEKVRDEALAARESAKAATAAALAAQAQAQKLAAAAAANAAANANAAASAAGAAKVAAAGENGGPAAEAAAPALPPEVPAMPVAPAVAAPIALPVIDRVVDRVANKPPKLPKPPKAPKWSKLEPVDIDAADIQTLEPAGRPRWMVPAGVATLVFLLVAVLYGVTHRTQPATDAVRIGRTTVVPTASATPAGTMPRGGFLTQSAGGDLAAHSDSMATRPFAAGASADSTAAAASSPAQAAPTTGTAATMTAPRADNSAASETHAATSTAPATRPSVSAAAPVTRGSTLPAPTPAARPAPTANGAADAALASERADSMAAARARAAQVPASPPAPAVPVPTQPTIDNTTGLPSLIKPPAATPRPDTAPRPVVPDTTAHR